MSKRPPPSSDDSAGDASLPAATSDTDWVAIGEIVGVFGVQGGLKVRPLTDFPERFQRTETVYLGEERQPHRVIGVSNHGRNVVLLLAGIDTPETGARWRGARLYVPDAEITPLPGDQFYVHDVIGLRVLRDDGVALGAVSDVISNGTNDLYVIRESRTGADVLLPAVKEFVKSVDLANGVMVVTPIPGLFDDDAEEAR